MEQQIRCFTCGFVTTSKYRHYEDYRRDLGLGPDDALDKAQILKKCCRMTILSQTDIAERVRAAGRPITGSSGKSTVVDVSDYPILKIERREEINLDNIITIAPNQVEIASFTDYTGYKPGISKIPKPTIVKPSANVVKGERAEPRPTRVVNYGVHELITMINRTKVWNKPKVWNLLNPDSFPLQDILDLPFAPENVDMKIMMEGGHFIEAEIESHDENDKVRTVSDFLNLLSDFVLQRVPKLFGRIFKVPLFINSPNRILSILKLKQNGQFPSIYDMQSGTANVLKVTYDRSQKTYTLILRTNSAYLYHDNKIESTGNRANLKLVDHRIIDVSTVNDRGLVLTLTNNVILTVKLFIIHDENEASNVKVERLLNTLIVSVEYKFQQNDVGLLMYLEPNLILECQSDVDVNSAGEGKKDETFLFFK